MTDLAFAFARHKTIPGEGVVIAASGVLMDHEQAVALAKAGRALFRGGIPLRPWLPFLPSPDVLREELRHLDDAIAAFDRHREEAGQP